jgi:hypothetical protein
VRRWLVEGIKDMNERRYDGLFAALISFSTGLMVAVLTAKLLPGWAHLPGGSLSAGMLTGMSLARQWRIRPSWMVTLTCALAGLCGWMFFVMVMSW